MYRFSFIFIIFFLIFSSHAQSDTSLSKEQLKQFKTLMDKNSKNDQRKLQPADFKKFIPFGLIVFIIIFNLLRKVKDDSESGNSHKSAKLETKALFPKSKALKEEEKNELVIEKFIEDHNDVINWSKEDQERLEKLVNPENISEKKIRKLPNFCQSYLAVYFTFKEDDYTIIGLEPRGEELGLKKLVNTKLVSIRKKDSEEIHHLHTPSEKPLEKFNFSTKAGTEVIIKYKKNSKIYELLIKTGSFNDYCNNNHYKWSNEFKLSKEQANVCVKEWKREYFYSGILLNTRMNKIKDQILKYEKKTLIDKFLSHDENDNIDDWPDHLLDRLKPILKPDVSLSDDLRKFKIFRHSYLCLFYQLSKEQKISTASKNTPLVIQSVGMTAEEGSEELSPGDTLISVAELKPGLVKKVRKEVEGKKIKLKKQSDLNIFLAKYKPGTNVCLAFKTRKGIIKKATYKTLSFNEQLLAMRSIYLTSIDGANDEKVDLIMKEHKQNYIQGFPNLTFERIREIIDMDLGTDQKENDNVDEDSIEDEKILISTSVKKEKVNGKESFALTLDDLPDDEKLETLTEDRKIFIKTYVFDETDIDHEKFSTMQDNEEDTAHYISSNVFVIKTNDVGWSAGDMCLIQSKELKPYEDFSRKFAFPYSVMLLPKIGKRTLSFRTFLCTDEQQFDDVVGRPKVSDLNDENISYEAEEFRMTEWKDTFDEYNSLPEILSYANSEIDIEYKEPGYLDLNRKKYNDLTIALGLALTQTENNNLKKNIETIKDEIRYDGDTSVTGNIYKTLRLKANYENVLKNKLNLEIVLQELKKNSRVHERYEMINFLLNLATRDQTFSQKENQFIDQVAKALELNTEKFQEIKKNMTAKVKFVNFGEGADESVFGITENMNKEEKKKKLRKEYSRWNALTNNNDKLVRERARKMRDLAATLRKQYS